MTRRADLCLTGEDEELGPGFPEPWLQVDVKGVLNIRRHGPELSRKTMPVRGRVAPMFSEASRLITHGQAQRKLQFEAKEGTKDK